jgi:hypothetical protein
MPGEKVWTGSRWEIDGVPITYKVTWTDIDTGEQQEREFTDIDQGYSFYEWCKKSRLCSGATWDHVPW